MDPLVHEIVKELKEKISDRYKLHEIRIFGSTARGDRRLDSDIDVFVRLSEVTRQIEEDLFDIAYELELKYDCLIDLIVFSDEALMERYAETPLYHEVISEGMIV